VSPAPPPGRDGVDLIAVGQAARSSSGARILDRGYRRYDGPRRGRRAAMRTLAIQTMQRTLGIKRSFGAKILPLIAVFIAYVPAIVFVGVTVLLKDLIDRAIARGGEGVLPTYGEYFGFVWAAILVFVAFVAPEVLCTDRRNGLLGLYLASPLNRDTYLVSKALSVAGALSLVTLGPPMLFLIGLTLNSRGPDGFGGFVTVLGQTILAGIVVSALYVSLTFAVASTTTRRAAASAAIILILLASSLFAQVLVNAARLDHNLLLADLLFMPFEIVRRIFDAPPIDRSFGRLSTSSMVVAYLAWTIGFAAFARFRYQRIQVTR